MSSQVCSNPSASTAPLLPHTPSRREGLQIPALPACTFFLLRPSFHHKGAQTSSPASDPQADTSVSFLPHLEAKIRQTHSLAHLLTKYAEQLLQEYVQHQGAPFGSPGFSPPRLPVAGLNAPAPGHAGLPLQERLRLDAVALAELPPLLDAVRRRQAELTPRAPRLLRRLEDAARQARALGTAVETVLAALGAAAHGPRREPAATAAGATPAPVGVFPAKLLGLRVCGLYREWVRRTEGDLGQLLPGGPA
ncbi:cardiotrophin-1 isoform X2 [Cavia porcellus]|uniref:cardiotrophin-1 isoform X2 n=1 Tax=Cavia porcellus TaxID=10141 RepID=UPI002FDFED65